VLEVRIGAPGYFANAHGAAPPLQLKLETMKNSGMRFLCSPDISGHPGTSLTAAAALWRARGLTICDADGKLAGKTWDMLPSASTTSQFMRPLRGEANQPVMVRFDHAKIDRGTAFYMAVDLGSISGDAAFVAVGLVEDSHPLVRAPGWANEHGDSFGYHSDDGAVILAHRPVMNPGGKTGASVKVASTGQAAAFGVGQCVGVGYDGDMFFFVDAAGTRFSANYLSKPTAGAPSVLSSFWTRGKTFNPVVYVMGETASITVKCETHKMTA
jgi:hypothetical protein